MKYIDLLNSFWSIQGDYPLDNHSRALYFYLANVWNECRRPSVFKRRNDVIERDLKITRNTLDKARKSLLKSDFISFETYNGIANVDYTLSKFDEVSGKPIKSSSNFDEVEEKAHQGLTSSEQTLSDNDEVLTESLSKFDEAEETSSKTLSESDNHKQRETETITTNKENNKKKSSISLIPTKNEVIDFFMSLKELKPSEAESRAESFYSHFSEIGWIDGKSIIFDWMKAAQEWKGEPKKEIEPILVFPYDSKEFLDKWNTLAQSPKWKKKQAKTLQLALDKLKEFDEEFSIELIDRAIIGEYQGLVFPNTKRDYQNWKNNEQRIIKISESGANTNRATTSDKRASRKNLDELADGILEQYKS